MLLTLLSPISYVPHSGGTRKTLSLTGKTALVSWVCLTVSPCSPLPISLLAWWLCCGCSMAHARPAHTSRPQKCNRGRILSQIVKSGVVLHKFGVVLNQKLTGGVLNKLRSRNTPYRTILSRFPSGYDQPLDVGDLYFT